MPPSHAFACRLTWTGSEHGSTEGYRAYSRAWRAEVEGKPALEGSAAPEFRGESSRHNPEDLLVIALSSCHCLSFLAIAARGSLRVSAYQDHATGRMELVDGGLRFVEVVLRPTVTVEGTIDEARIARMHREAHDACFIARSVAFSVVHEPKLVTSAR